MLGLGKRKGSMLRTPPKTEITISRLVQKVIVTGDGSGRKRFANKGAIGCRGVCANC